MFYNTAWPAWVALACLFGRGRRRENLLAIFGPLSFLLLMACWAIALLVGFAMVQWGFGSHVNVVQGPGGFWTDLYLSGTTLFTLGIGDVTPSGAVARVITVVEAGVGFGFLALVIGYLPVLYQGFSRREVLWIETGQHRSQAVERFQLGALDVSAFPLRFLAHIQNLQRIGMLRNLLVKIENGNLRHLVVRQSSAVPGQIRCLPDSPPLSQYPRAIAGCAIPPPVAVLRQRSRWVGRVRLRCLPMMQIGR